MPIVNADVKNLEGCVFADLANDSVMIKEITEKQDLHTNNQRDFGLPNRLVAKRFLFKLIYGATAYGYATDPDFLFMKMNDKQWQVVIDTFYKKYFGGAAWHRKIINDAQTNRKLVVPSGRSFPFEPIQVEGRYIRNRDGSLKWPITQIKNYPVQGFGADLVMLARLEAKKLIDESKLKADFICTIHDSIVVDTPSDCVEQVGRILLESVWRVPMLCKQVWNYNFKVPLFAEVQAGINKKEMHELLLT